jgi:iron complex outermembrane receptor protein
MRAQPTERFSWDLAVFYFDYEDLQGFVPQGFSPPFFAPLLIDNVGEGAAYGGEIAFNYDVTCNWRLFGSYSFLRMSLDGDSIFEASSPRNRAYLQSSWDLGCDWEFDLIWRYVDSLLAQGVGSYNVMDIRLAWVPTQEFEAAVVARNLLDAEHPEFGFDGFTGNFNTEVEREIYGMLTWRY